MKLYRVLLSSQTASFRYPNFISSNQLSIKALPYSTLQGLIASATGDDKINNFEFSYIFRYQSTYEDLETIYKFERKENRVSNTTIQDIFRREILFDCYLTLYLKDKDIAEAFKSPIFQLLLGRSSDLLRVEEVKEIEVKEQKEVILNGTILPFREYKVAGEIYAMAKYFDYSEIVRKPIDVQPFVILDGIGSFIENPRDKIEKFDLKNWKFAKLATRANINSLFDEELNSYILLRNLC